MGISISSLGVMFRKDGRKRGRSSGSDRGTPSPISEAESSSAYARSAYSPPIDIKYTYEQRQEKDMFVLAKRNQVEGGRKARNVYGRLTTTDLEEYDLGDFGPEREHPAFCVRNFGDVHGNFPNAPPQKIVIAGQGLKKPEEEEIITSKKQGIGEEKEVFEKEKQVIDNVQNRAVTEESSERTFIQNGTNKEEPGRPAEEYIRERVPQKSEARVIADYVNAGVTRENELKDEATGFKNVTDNDFIVYGSERKPLSILLAERDEWVVQGASEGGLTFAKNYREYEEALRVRVDLLEADLTPELVASDKYQFLPKLNEGGVQTQGGAWTVPQELAENTNEPKLTYILKGVDGFDFESELKTSPGKIREFLEAIQSDSMTYGVPQKDLEPGRERKRRPSSTLTTNFLNRQHQKSQLSTEKLALSPVSSDEEVSKYMSTGAIPKRIVKCDVIPEIPEKVEDSCSESDKRSENLVNKSKEKLMFPSNDESEPIKRFTNKETQTEIRYRESVIKRSWDDMTYLIEDVPFHAPKNKTVGTQVSEMDFFTNEPRKPFNIFRPF